MCLTYYEWTEKKTVCDTLRFDNCFTSLLNIIDGRKSLQVILRRLVLIFSYMYSWYFSGEEDDKEKTCDVVIFFYSFEKEKEKQKQNLKKKLKKRLFLNGISWSFFIKNFLKKQTFSKLRSSAEARTQKVQREMYYMQNLNYAQDFWMRRLVWKL